jgi:hypothetical protein
MLTKTALAEIKAFVKERDEMLLANDVERCHAFHAKHNPSQPKMPDHICQIAIHKARTAAKSLPKEARLESKRWLLERNYTSLDDDLVL